ncbi:MAG: PIN domain-containing protein [Planctomycetes bacterium]|nr:PIN domain-containing protein [Planctomycetota bacterium]
MRVYLDSCVYNRPFDDHQLQENIFIEAVAFYILLKWVEEGKIETLSSDALAYENERMSDPDRKLRIRTYFSFAKYHVELSDTIIKRAKEIVNLGFKALDALHLSMAEFGNADYFITCDATIIKKGKNLHNKLRVRIMGILEFFTEVLYVKNIEGN